MKRFYGILILILLSLSRLSAQDRCLQLYDEGHVVFPDNPAFDLGSNFTIEVWIKFFGSFGMQGIAGNQTAPGAPGWNLYLGPVSGGGSHTIYFSTPSQLVEASAASIYDNGWHHIAVVYDGVSPVVYIDGTATGVTGSVNVAASSNPLHIFSVGGGPPQMTGFMDNFRIWNVARSQSQISSNMNVNFGGPQTGLVVNIPMNEGSGNTISSTITSPVTGTYSNGSIPAWGCGVLQGPVGDATVIFTPNDPEICDNTTMNLSFGSSNATSYQWFYNGSLIPGETSDNLTITPYTSSNDGAYYMEAYNSCSMMRSGIVNTIVKPLPTITTQPQPQSECRFDPVNFSVAATTSGLSYQWYQNGSPIIGATNSTYSTTSDFVFEGDYTVDVTNTCGTTPSAPASLTMKPLPTIDIQPVDQQVCENSPATFNVSSSAAVAFEWAVNDPVNNILPGETNDFYTIPSATGAETGNYYYARVIGSNGCVNVSTGVQVDLDPAPQVISDPVSADYCAPNSISLTGSGNYTTGYQWYKDGVPIPGANANQYDVISSTTGDAGTYRVDFIGNCGTVSSADAVIKVFAGNPNVDSESTLSSVCDGAPLFLSVSSSDATGYSWHKDGSPLSEFNDTYSTTANIGSTGDYFCRLSNACGNTLSTTSSITVSSAPVINTQPAPDIICAGSSLSVSVSATGATAYQWYQNSTVIPGATTDTYNKVTSTPGDDGDYYCEVSNGTCSVNSSTVTIGVTSSAPVFVNTPVDGSGCVGFPDGINSLADYADTYQWFKDGSIMIGETNAFLNFNEVAPSDAGLYHVQVTNDCGAANSPTVTYTTTVGAPNFLIQPASGAGCIGQQHIMNTQVTNYSTLQWFKDGSPLAGASGEDLVFNPLTASDDGSYQLIAQNACSTSVSNTAVLIADPCAQASVLYFPFNSVTKEYGDQEFNLEVRVSYARRNEPIYYKLASGNSISIDTATGVMQILNPGISWIKAYQLPYGSYGYVEDSAEINVLKAQPHIRFDDQIFLLSDSNQGKQLFVQILDGYDGVITFTKIAGTSADVASDGTIDPIAEGDDVMVTASASETAFYAGVDLTANIKIVSELLPPIAVNDSATMYMDTTLAIDIIDNDTGRTGHLVLTQIDMDPRTSEINTDFFDGSNYFQVDSLGVVTLTQHVPTVGEMIMHYIIYDSRGQASNSAKIVINVKKRAELPPLQATEMITPNDDNFNDYFVIGYTDGTKSNTFAVYDRQGTEVYKTDDYKNDWQGVKTNGSKVDDGVYFYVYDEDDGNRVLRGTVIVKR